MQHEWQIPRSGQSCSHCGKQFEVDQSFIACVYPQEEVLARLDFCVECVGAQPADPVGSWRAKRAAPSARKTAVIDRESLYSFFMSMTDSEDVQRRQFRFVLALLLWRQKVLKLVDTAGEGINEVWQMAEPRSGDTFTIPRPELDDTQIEQLSQQLEALIAGESQPSSNAEAASAQV